jgi:ubiquinone/menaquinone biosynthesis C-methylase UbiE
MSSIAPQASAAPDRHAAIERYREHAPGYDASARHTMPLRRRAIDKLGLRPGDRVLDVACGTGLSFSWLSAGVGPAGRVIGVELSPDMCVLARRRCLDEQLSNVVLLEASMEEAAIDGPLDAILFNYTHDVLRSPAALARIFSAARPGARVAVAGMKLPPWWLAPLNPIVRARARPYMTTFDGLDRPWSLLAGYLESFRWEHTIFTTNYIGWGTVRTATTDYDRPAARPTRP